ncbi:MAG: XdhC/CoxI family protein [Polyangia bacterium]|jgi:xanthine dehydrogenase accessory factor|nr:XdhC/CoxI family protein [Polyangia bacterium]
MTSIFDEILEVLRSGERGVLATVVETHGSVPQSPGARMIILGDGRILGTVGGGALEHKVRAMAPDVQAAGAPRLVSFELGGDLGMACGGSAKVFLEPLGRGDRLYVFGAGHIAEHLCELASRCGFMVTVVDARDELRRPERFPSAFALSPACAANRLGELDLAAHAGDAYVMVVTHSHDIDFSLVQALLPLGLPYLGMIGSRAKAAKLQQALKDAGVPEDQRAKVRSPAGLPLGGRSPAEIAVSIVAELVQERSRRGEGSGSSASADPCTDRGSGSG